MFAYYLKSLVSKILIVNIVISVSLAIIMKMVKYVLKIIQKEKAI